MDDRSPIPPRWLDPHFLQPLVPEPSILREGLLAALEEMRVWTRLMAEHAKFIRMGLDPNRAQEELFREADRFAVRLDALYDQTIHTSPHAPTDALYALREQTIHVVNELIRFKREIIQALEDCKALAILPAVLCAHVRREADRFVGTLERSKTGLRTKTYAVLGLPDGNRRAETLPRLLYGRVTPATLHTVAMEEILFFSRTHAEHAGHLALTFRPEVQDAYRREALAFEKAFEELLHLAMEVERSGQGMRKLLTESRKATEAFCAYLSKTLRDLTTCRIPTGQANFPPLIADHMRREALYYLDILHRLEPVLAT